MTYANITVLTEIEHKWSTINLRFNGLLRCIIILTTWFIVPSYFNKKNY